MYGPTNQEKVIQFHKCFDLPVRTELTLDVEELKLRRKLIEEEYKEVLEVVDDMIEGHEKFGPGDLAKELADLLIVTYGAAVTFGIDLNKSVDIVHESNMSKLGLDGKPIKREDGKVLKGPNYKTADMTKPYEWKLNNG